MFKRFVRFATVWPFLIALSQYSSLGQGFNPILSASVGLIENLQTDLEFSQYTVYSELQVSAALATINHHSLAITGSIYSGGWFDGVDTVSDSRHGNITHSHSSLIVGARLQIAPTRLVFPALIYAGLSRHFVWAEYVGGTSYIGIPGDDYNDSINTAEFGFRLQFPVGQRLELGGGAQWYLTLPFPEGVPDPTRTAYVVTASYRTSE